MTSLKEFQIRSREFVDYPFGEAGISFLIIGLVAAYNTFIWKGTAQNAGDWLWYHLRLLDELGQSPIMGPSDQSGNIMIGVTYEQLLGELAQLWKDQILTNGVEYAPEDGTASAINRLFIYAVQYIENLGYDLKEALELSIEKGRWR